MLKTFNLGNFIRKTSLKLFLATITGIITALPSHAAETIYFTYSSLKFSLKVESLVEYAETGKINRDLEFYLGLVNEKEQKEFRNVLTDKAEIDPILLSRMLKTSIGEDLLSRLGTIMNIPWGINGIYGIRGALVTSALQPEGLTLLNFLQEFPKDLHIDLNRSLKVASAVENVVNASEKMIKEMAILTTEEAKNESAPNFSELPDLRKRGEYGFVSETITLNDSQRNRQFRLIIYQPERWRDGKTPVVVLSHGLVSNPEDFNNAAEQLASYGYVVALPQHIGSDSQKAKDFIDGYSGQVFDVEEFINRPQDISFVLDYLEQQNQTTYDRRLNLKEVGIIGHSLGGYTALAVAGATLDFDYLTEQCDINRPRINTSLLLQCRALDLPQKEYNFRDKRVSAIIAINPVNSSIFGPKGLNKVKIPVLMIAGSYDPATPAVYEQFRSFPWLGSKDKYLCLAEGQAHVDFSKLDPGIQESINSLEFLTLPTPGVLNEYGNSLMTSFFSFYVDKDDNYRPYIDNIANYSQYLSQEQEFKIYLVTDKSSDSIEKDINELGINK